MFYYSVFLPKSAYICMNVAHSSLDACFPYLFLYSSIKLSDS